MANSKISGFYKKSIQERLRILQKNDLLNKDDYTLLKNGKGFLQTEESDKMIENVISVFGLPMGMGLNFLVNGKDYAVPMVVEEPSIVAAVSSMAKIIRQAGGFISESSEPILIGQIQVVDIKNLSAAKNAVLTNKEEIINLANSMHPNMVARGGGVRDVEVRILKAGEGKKEMLIVHLLVDVQDAMGANLVNSMCEGVASLIEKITGGRVFLRILSNLTDRSMVKTTCTIPTKLLDGKKYSGDEVRDGIILANDFAEADPYRAATHNKGIMNGIDPLIIATGNDWRAIEAGAHAYAARSGQYTSLTKWFQNENGDLVGILELPVRVGIVGGSLESNPMVGVAYRLLGINSARELAELIGAVGLAQNLGAIRALATEGIQSGHMSLHARSVAMTAGATPDEFETVVEELIDSGDIKVWKAKEIIENIKTKETKSQVETILSPTESTMPTGFGKIILLGEHAVVYGSHAIAAPVPLAMQAKVNDSNKEGIHLLIPRWGVEERLYRGVEHKYSIFQSLDLILDELDLHDRNMQIEVFPHVPRAMGLGGSAALAVAIIRALSEHYKLNLADKRIADLSYKSENIVHGTASGIDNTLATYGRFIQFKKGTPPIMQNIEVKEPIRVVIGLTWVESLTAKMVTRVAKAWEGNKKLYNHIFLQIDELVLEAGEAIKTGNLEQLGELMNINQGYLNALQVSGREIEEIIDIARSNGALGAKLTGGGGGGAIIALCPDNWEIVAKAIRAAGYQAMVADIK
ncbi:MAG: hydroxymethylglutaryl-CoA reductase, degradative [Calditrichaeota bacterium]|nr:MAG: hydroxymethylglutaryl-CoA reductase, degradative [Calditrichota bacterium]MBL1206853.1 hydroxymethylglutaryl-CoA reductase, degradative [Calditrichota bacterium]NOG46680.1 hydroxymethylglutaryl-CoA reductase, degradative [Calditrichota bacterium]